MENNQNTIKMENNLVLPIPRGEEVYTSTEWKGDRWETRVDYSTGETEYYDGDGKIVSIVIDSIPYYAIK